MQKLGKMRNVELLFWIVDDSEEEIRVCGAIGDGKDERLVDCDFCERWKATSSGWRGDSILIKFI